MLLSAAPAHLRHISDTGDQRDHILAAPAQAGEIRFFNLPHIEHLIGARAELRGVSDLVAVLQGVDLSKVVGHTSVMARKPNIAVPAGGGFEMPGAFGKALQAFVLIHLDGKPQRGDLQPAQAAVLIKEAVREGELVAAQAGIRGRGAFIVGRRRQVDCFTADGAAAS